MSRSFFPLTAAFLLGLILTATVRGAQEQLIKAVIRCDTSRVMVGQVVRFDGSGSVSGKQTEMFNMYWDFNDMDDVEVEAYGDSVSHVFNLTGAYTVRLVVENDRGERDQAYCSIEVLPGPGLGPTITNCFQGGKTGLFFKTKENFAFRCEWGLQWYFRLDNCKGQPVTLNIVGYGPNRPVPPSVTSYRDDYSFDDKFTAMASSDYLNPDWEPLTDASYAYDPETASLIISFRPDTEPVYLAWSTPYTMRNLQAFIGLHEDHPAFRWKPIGTSVEGRPICLITITDPDIDDRGKKVVWITGTQHAYEMAAGPVCEGIAEALLDDSDSAAALRSQFVYQMVPLMNPDAVARGGYRYNMHDVDLNRNWDEIQQDDWDRSISEPEVAAVINEIQRWVDQGDGLDFFFDFHCMTALTDTLLMIRAVPDSLPGEIAGEQERFVRDFFSKRYVWRFSTSNNIGTASGYIAEVYGKETGVRSFTAEHALGRMQTTGGALQRTTPRLLKQLGRDYVWVIKDYFDHAQ